MNRPSNPLAASDPTVSAFVSANAGSGKTTMLVNRVARLLLAGAPPATILCVTFTKAAAAEMQRRLFALLGHWSVLEDAPLAKALAEIGEKGRDLAQARRLFARALETPGGLQIQTLHAFCERLLRRFPIESGLPPAFAVMDDAQSEEALAEARETLAEVVASGARPDLTGSYVRLAASLSFDAFNGLFETLASARALIAAFAEECAGRAGGLDGAIWRDFGFAGPTTAAEVEREAVQGVAWTGWRKAVAALAASRNSTDRKLAAAMGALNSDSSFDEVAAIFFTQGGTPRARMATGVIAGPIRDWLERQQTRIVQRRGAVLAARGAEATLDVLRLGVAFGAIYRAGKERRSQLDFGDLILRALGLLTLRKDAAWVLYKLDGGLEHVLVDEAQDTSPEQWGIVRALTAEFFAGEGAAGVVRTLFAVGDEKQSIYSFQGAAPARLAEEAQALELRARAAGLPFRQTPLLANWRSRPDILSFVDEVCADPAVAVGLAPAGVERLALRHEPQRTPRGAVDLWPPEAGDPTADPDPDAPVDAEPRQSANKRLARRIATAIQSMVAAGEAVGEADGRSPGRPCRYRDILILVRRRGALYDEIGRALKAAGAPFAGADRLALDEHGLYDDLMSLARFARFPGDDLSLAESLRGPFCEVDEDALFDLAHGRRGGLWAELERRAGERPAWGEARTFLGWAIGQAAAGPFAFFAGALARLDGQGRSMRQRLLTRLGGEAEQALDAFLDHVLATEADGVRDLERFIARTDASHLEIRRESAEGGGADEVRLMTVHGAKGLEAPIVFLPDTTRRPPEKYGPLLRGEGPRFAWSASAKADSAPAAEIRAGLRQAADEEASRLLYVALTRARDRLIVCGVRHGSGHDKHVEGSWYARVEAALARLETHEIELPGGDGATGLRYGLDPEGLGQAAAAGSGGALPPWAGRLAPDEPAAAGPLSPSRLGETDEGPTFSPLDEAGGLGRWRRGEIIHRLLQVLPDLAPVDRPAAAARLLAREADLDDRQRGEMIAAALSVTEDPRFSAVFGPGSRAEVPVAGPAPRLPAGVVVSGRIDRLVVMEDRVLVADYKTNRPAPDALADVDPAYVRQMAVYAAVLAEVFPGRAVEAALVWTDGPKLMPIPPAALDAALSELAR